MGATWRCGSRLNCVLNVSKRRRVRVDTHTSLTALHNSNINNIRRSTTQPNERGTIGSTKPCRIAHHRDSRTRSPMGSAGTWVPPLHRRWVPIRVSTIQLQSPTWHNTHDARSGARSQLSAPWLFCEPQPSAHRFGCRAQRGSATLP